MGFERNIENRHVCNLFDIMVDQKDLFYLGEQLYDYVSACTSPYNQIVESFDLGNLFYVTTAFS